MEKVEAKTTSWESKKSLGWRLERATLIKSVAQMIPNYTMATFKLTRRSINEKLDVFKSIYTQISKKIHILHLLIYFTNLFNNTLNILIVIFT